MPDLAPILATAIERGRFERIAAFPLATTVRARLALTDAVLADLHARCGWMVLAVAGAPGGSGASVLVGTDAAASSPEQGWPGVTTAPFAQPGPGGLAAACWETYVPEVRLEVDWEPADLDAPPILEHLRLLEELRRPAGSVLVVEAVPLDAAAVEAAVARMVTRIRPEVATMAKQFGFADWRDHHVALRAAGEVGAAAGVSAWSVVVHLGGPDAGSIGAAHSALNESLRLVTPFHLVPMAPGSSSGTATSHLISGLGLPPFGEIPGYRTSPVWFFDQTQEVGGAGDGDDLGRILSPTGSPGPTFSLSPTNLVRHTFVTGATGSGKTETVKTMVRNLDVPWLIIEPAKAEYRHLLDAAGSRPTILRPGDPSVPPLQLNPLQPHPGFPLQTHIDLTLALFLAAFEPADPLPQVLSAALHQTYQDAGWIVPLGRLPAAGRDDPVAGDYPSLSDLQRVASTVIERIGYGQEAHDNVRGFVDVRLASLRLGTAGRLFEAGHPIDFDALMERDVVLELEDIGSEQEKSFVMGAFLVRLYEYLRCAMDERRRAGASSRPLSHVTVVEEAHRLLRAATPGEKPNFAIETFANMLAELRSYGEGLVIVEQVPAKIIADAVKNTGTKVLHRLPSVDDREFAGLAANLPPESLGVLGELTPGQAIAFTNDMDRPVRIMVTRSADDGVDESVAATERPGTEQLADPDGRVCDVDAACTLEAMVLAEHWIDANPAASMWAEVAVVLATGGFDPVPPAVGIVEAVAGAPRCVTCRMARSSTALRRRAIRESGGDPEEWSRRLRDFLTSGSGGSPDLAADVPAAAWNATVASRLTELVKALGGEDAVPEDIQAAVWPDAERDMADFLVRHVPAAFPAVDGAASSGDSRDVGTAIDG